MNLKYKLGGPANFLGRQIPVVNLIFKNKENTYILISCNSLLFRLVKLKKMI